MTYEAQEPDALNIGTPKGTAKELHLQHHYMTREKILSVVLNSDNRINVKKLEYLVKLHASQIPSSEQYNKICTLFEKKRTEYLSEILTRKNKKDYSTDDFEEATCKACVDAEELIQLIMDDDLAIREVTTVGFN